MIRPLVRRHGRAAVARAGMEALGYPATWATSAAEVAKVRQFLKGET